MVDSTYRHTRASVGTTPSPVTASVYRHTRAGLRNTVVDSTYRHTRASLTNSGGSTYRHTRAALTSPVLSAPLKAVVGPQQFVDCFVDCYLDASASEGNFTTDDVLWAQIGDSRVATFTTPTVPPIGSGPTVVIRPPAYRKTGIGPSNYDLTYRATINNDVEIATATVVVTVYAWLFWKAGTGGPADWQPLLEYDLQYDTTP